MAVSRHMSRLFETPMTLLKKIDSHTCSFITIKVNVADIGVYTGNRERFGDEYLEASCCNYLIIAIFA